MSDYPGLVREPPPISYPEPGNHLESGSRRLQKRTRQLQKRTRQLQEAISEIINQLPRGVHITAPEIFRRARDRGLSVSLSTVYRLLNLMQEDGNVSTLSGEHGRRYEARDSEHDHHHLICLKCGLTIEFEDELIGGFGKAVAERKGYDHKSSRFDILGICSDCKSKDEDHKIASSIDALETAIELSEQAVERMRNAVALLKTRKLARAQELVATAASEMSQASAECASAADHMSQPLH